MNIFNFQLIGIENGGPLYFHNFTQIFRYSTEKPVRVGY